MKIRLQKKVSVITSTIQTSLAMVIPILFIGSITVMLNSFPIQAYQDFLNSFLGGALRSVIQIIQFTTVGILAVYLTIAINQCYIRQTEEGQRLVFGFSSLLGCLTGFYLILKGTRAPKELYGLLLGAFRSVQKAKEVPGTAPENCGRYLMHDLEMAKWYAREFAAYLEANAENPSIFEYPQAERLVTEDGRDFYDS